MISDYSLIAMRFLSTIDFNLFTSTINDFFDLLLLKLFFADFCLPVSLKFQVEMMLPERKLQLNRVAILVVQKHE